jgi:hypothetical protein
MVTRLLERWLLLGILPPAKPDSSQGATALVQAILNQAIQERRKTPLLQVSQASKRFGGKRVLTKIDHEVAEHETRGDRPHPYAYPCLLPKDTKTIG